MAPTRELALHLKQVLAAYDDGTASIGDVMNASDELFSWLEV